MLEQRPNFNVISLEHLDKPFNAARKWTKTSDKIHNGENWLPLRTNSSNFTCIIDVTISEIHLFEIGTTGTDLIKTLLSD